MKILNLSIAPPINEYMVDETLLKQLLEEREKLLAENPSLRQLQAEIDRTLAAAGPEPMARARKSFELLTDILRGELIPELEHLKKSISSAITGAHLRTKSKGKTG